jgi:hypothetical protein
MPGALKRTGWIRRKSRPVEDRVTPELHEFVLARDDYRCIATRFSSSHVCQGPLTFEHVPEAGKNAIGKRAPSNRYHGVAACQGAQNGWCLSHRDDERAWLALFYGPGPYPEGPDAITDPG